VSDMRAGPPVVTREGPFLIVGAAVPRSSRRVATTRGGHQIHAISAGILSQVPGAWCKSSWPVSSVMRVAAQAGWSSRISSSLWRWGLPHTTPHTLRRTYISIALLANRFDVLWVMGQAGHADSKMTLDVYAQLQQRVKREHGRAFDTLVRRAREQLYGTTSGLAEAAPEPNLGHESGHEATLGESDGARDERIGEQESSDLQADRGMARPGLEPGTPRFSGVAELACAA
jgi:hypothetical protein